MIPRRTALLAAGLLLLPLRAMGARTNKPRVPPGRDPGGVAVALLTSGLDYTAADIAARLARDGEGELIGWDQVDGDRRPYAPDGNAAATWDGVGTALARALVATETIRLIPIRVEPLHQQALAQALAFAAATPARFVLVPAWYDRPEIAVVLQQAARLFPQLVIIAPAQERPAQGPDASGKSPAADAPNLLIVSAFATADADIAVELPADDGARPLDRRTPAGALALFVTAMAGCGDPKVASELAGHRKARQAVALLPAADRRPNQAAARSSDCRIRVLRQ